MIECLRTDMLEEAGFTVDDFTDITWNDFMEKAKLSKRKTGQPILTSQAGSPDLVMEMLQSCGESLFNEDGSVNIVDNKALKPILEIYSQMVKRWYSGRSYRLGSVHCIDQQRNHSRRYQRMLDHGFHHSK